MARVSLRGDTGPVVAATAVFGAARSADFLSLRLSLAVMAIAMAIAVTRTAGGGARSRTLVVFLAVLLVVVRSHSQTELLGRTLPAGTVSGVARLVTDPAMRGFDVRAVVTLDGRRYVASVPTAEAAEFKTLMAGRNVAVRGTVDRMADAPRGWLLSNHLAGRMKVSSVVAHGDEPLWSTVANTVRRRIGRSGSSIDHRLGPLYLGLVIGDDRNQSDLQRYRFRASGLSHLLAVSGQNVAFVLLVAAPVLRRLGSVHAFFVAVVLLAVFAVVTRAEPSVLRAVTMTLVALSAGVVGREASALRALSLAVIVLVVLDPLISHSTGFALSVAATLGLVVLAEPLAERIPGPAWIVEPLAMTLAAQLATAPILLAFVGSIPAVAVPANLLAVPAAGFVMMAGLTVGLVAGSLRGDVAAVLMWPVERMVRWVDGVATTASRLHLAPLTPLRLVMLSGLVALTVTVVGNRDHPWSVRARARIVMGLVAAVLTVAVVVPRPPGAGSIDLGSGSQLVRDECGRSTLVIAKGSDGVALLESLDTRHAWSIDRILVDDSASAMRAAALVAEQFPSSRLVDGGRGSGGDVDTRCRSAAGASGPHVDSGP